MSRPLFGPIQVFNPDNNDMSGNLTGSVTILKSMSIMGYGVSWVGTAPVGAVSVQVSNDYSQNADGSVNNPGTWNTMPFAVSGTVVTSIAVSGATGNGYIDIAELSAYAIRPVYTSTSGSGTLSAVVTGKVA